MDFTELPPRIQDRIIQDFEEQHPGVEYDEGIDWHLAWCQDEIIENGIGEMS